MAGFSIRYFKGFTKPYFKTSLMFKFNHFYACSDKEGPYKRAHIAALLLYCAKGAVDERYIRRGESHSTSTAAPLAQQRRSAEVEEPFPLQFLFYCGGGVHLPG